MSKIRVGLLLCTMLVPAAALAADLPKEGSFKATFFETEVPGKTAMIPTVDGKIALSREASFVYTNDAGSGFLHRATGRCLISLTAKGEAFHAFGPCTYADQDGDLIFSTFDISGAGNGPPVGTKEYIGGTGKYAGLTGHATFTVSALKPMDKNGPRALEGHVQGSYKIGAIVAGAAK